MTTNENEMEGERASLCINPIINVIFFSLSEGIFPSSFKQAIVHPLLKKPSLPDDDLNNFRPISNLNFISKILEKVVASRFQSHLLSNSLSSSFQSAYRMFHSTETTLLSIHNDLILAMDHGEVTSLILLDSSAAFDTVDHSISFFIVFNIGLVFMALLLTVFHLILPCVLRQSPSKIPLHLSQIFLVVYLKVPSAHFFSLFIQLLLALSSPRISIKYHLYAVANLRGRQGRSPSESQKWHVLYIISHVLFRAFFLFV